MRIRIGGRLLFAAAKGEKKREQGLGETQYDRQDGQCILPGDRQMELTVKSGGKGSQRGKIPMISSTDDASVPTLGGSQS